MHYSTIVPIHLLLLWQLNTRHIFRLFANIWYLELSVMYNGLGFSDQ